MYWCLNKNVKIYQGALLFWMVLSRDIKLQQTCLIFFHSNWIIILTLILNMDKSEWHVCKDCTARETDSHKDSVYTSQRHSCMILQWNLHNFFVVSFKSSITSFSQRTIRLLVTTGMRVRVVPKILRFQIFYSDYSENMYFTIKQNKHGLLSTNNLAHLCVYIFSSFSVNKYSLLQKCILIKWMCNHCNLKLKFASL
jgi:hypothetical protein